jgi:hypothetical protein
VKEIRALGLNVELQQSDVSDEGVPEYSLPPASAAE